MIPEIALLGERFSGQQWNKDTQTSFMLLLKDMDFFHGTGEKDPAFSARDRINRAPKSLGFVNLKPVISLTPAGLSLIGAKRTQEIFLRQLLKFQLPSPFHKPSAHAAMFFVKPYLEILRLVCDLGFLRFDELQIFAMQLTNWRKAGEIVDKIKRFRSKKEKNHLPYKRFRDECLKAEVASIYESDIKVGDVKTREIGESSAERFIAVKAANLRDYADACVRYLRATGIVDISHAGKFLSIAVGQTDVVNWILENIDRNPCFVDDEKRYIEYLGNAELPALPSDSKAHVLRKLKSDFDIEANPSEPISKLKELLAQKTESRKVALIAKQTAELKRGKLYGNIESVFAAIKAKTIYDPPLMLEWNVWRAMTMLDGGDIKANLKFDDAGHPMSTAQGNAADIICDYGDFALTVEVTTATGQRQYETEGESVARHLAKYKVTSGKPTYCLFIAPVVNDAAVAHFYVLQKTNVSYYGGRSLIVPLPLDVFQKMLCNSTTCARATTPADLKAFFESAAAVAKTSTDECEWFEAVKQNALNWLKA